MSSRTFVAVASWFYVDEYGVEFTITAGHSRCDENWSGLRKPEIRRLLREDVDVSGTGRER
jgi:hypothetical protein